MSKSLILRAIQPGDDSLPAYSFSMLTAINTCPMWGHVTYGLRKKLSDGVGRAMPLEAGALMHQMFSAVRVFQLLKQGLSDHAWQTADRLFGVTEDGYRASTRVDSVVSAYVVGAPDFENAKNIALAALHSAGWQDDINDRRRTMAEMEVSTIAYLQQYNYDNEVWVSDVHNPLAPVGIEWPFEFVLVDSDSGLAICRIIGTIDGISYSRRAKRITVDENKTSGRLNDAWEYGHTMSHQMTMYTIAATILTGQTIEYCNLYGVQIPQPRKSDSAGTMVIPINRRPDHIRAFANWVYHSVQAYEEAASLDIGEVVQYTHSCNRYFRPCSLIPFCYSDIDERREMLDSMSETDMTPTEQALAD